MEILKLSDIYWISNNKNSKAEVFRAKFNRTKKSVMSDYKGYENWFFWVKNDQTKASISSQPKKRAIIDMAVLEIKNKMELVNYNTETCSKWGDYAPYWFLKITKKRRKFGIFYREVKEINLNVHGSKFKAMLNSRFLHVEQLKNGVEKVSIKVDIDGYKYRQFLHYIVTIDGIKMQGDSIARIRTQYRLQKKTWRNR